MSTSEEIGVAQVNDDVNDLAVQYIIPVSVIVGVLLAAITIGCVCYRRWRFILKIKKQRQQQGGEQGVTKTSSISEDEDEETTPRQSLETEANLVATGAKHVGGMSSRNQSEGTVVKQTTSNSRNGNTPDPFKSCEAIIREEDEESQSQSEDLVSGSEESKEEKKKRPKNTPYPDKKDLDKSPFARVRDSVTNSDNREPSEVLSPYSNDKPRAYLAN